MPGSAERTPPGALPGTASDSGPFCARAGAATATRPARIAAKAKEAAARRWRAGWDEAVAMVGRNRLMYGRSVILRGILAKRGHAGPGIGAMASPRGLAVLRRKAGQRPTAPGRFR